MIRNIIAACLLGLAGLPAQAAERTVRVIDNRFDPAEITIEAGDTVIWTNQGNNQHNVNADDDSFRCANGCDGEAGGDGDPARNGWSVSLTFDEPGEIPYHCDFHRTAGMTGNITVKQSEPDGMPINFGHGGSWYNPDQDGQGFSLEVVPIEQEGEPDLLVAYWFTFAPDDGAAARLSKQGVEDQRWYQAQGPIEGSEAVLDVLRVTGGVFDDPQTVSPNTIGTATFSFASCTEAAISYSLDLDGDGSEETTGNIDLVRLTPDVLCEEMTSGG